MDWTPIVAGLGGVASAVLVFVVGRRTAQAQQVTALGGLLDAKTREWSALQTSANALMDKVQADNATVRSQNERLQADLAALHLKHATDMTTVHEKLDACDAQNAALILAMRDLQVDLAQGRARTEDRLQELERGEGADR